MTSDSPGMVPQAGDGRNESFLARIVREARVFVTFHPTWRALAWALPPCPPRVWRT